MCPCHKMTIEFHVWALSLQETTTFISRLIQATSIQQQRLTKARKKLSTEESWPHLGKSHTYLEILTSPRVGHHGMYSWKTLEKPQIDKRLKETKNA